MSDFELTPTTVDYGNLNPNGGKLKVIFGGDENHEINIFNPTVNDIHIKDIILGLSNKPHFSGMSKRFFSIAEHSILVKKLLEKYLLEKEIKHPDLIGVFRYALLHDAAEAYIGDMITPIKLCFPKFKSLESIWEKVIFEKFGVTDYKHVVKQFDVEALNIEADCFYNGAKHEFINYFLPDKISEIFTHQFENIL